MSHERLMPSLGMPLRVGNKAPNVELVSSHITDVTHNNHLKSGENNYIMKIR